MLIDIEFEWDGLELKSADEDAYRETHHKFSERYRSIYSRYFGTDNIPMQQRIYSNAEKRCKVHFSKYYNTQEWRETDVGKENASINA